MRSRNGRVTLEQAVAVGLAVLAVAFLASLFRQDVRFCRTVFVKLVKGDQSVGNAIDWDHLKALDVDVSATYAQLPNFEAKAAYRQAFIKNFAEGFHKSSGKLEEFTSWHTERDGSIAVEYPAKKRTLVFRLSPEGKRRLTGIAWKAL